MTGGSLPEPVEDQVTPHVGGPADDSVVEVEPEPVSTRDLVLDAAVIVLAFVAAGVLLGLLWPQLVDPVESVRNEFGIATDEVALSLRFDNDAWYSVLAAAGGLLLGVVMMAWRRTHEVFTLLAVTAGSLIASSVMSKVGTWAGPPDPTDVLTNAEIGATAAGMVKVGADAAYYVWPIAAVAGCLVVLLSPPGRSLLRRTSRDNVEDSDVSS